MNRLKKNESDVPAADYHRALHGQYRVWMMTSDGDSAQLVEYEMDQEAIEEFLEDYTRFADLLVRVEVKETPVDAQGVSENAAGPEAQGPTAQGPATAPGQE